QEFLEFSFRADGDAGKAGPEVTAAFADQNAVAREFSEERGARLAKIGDKEIGGAWIDAHVSLLEFTRKPCAQPLDVPDIPRDGCAFFHRGHAGGKRRGVDG